MSNKILIIDDEEDIVTVLSYRLKSKNYEVETAFNGREGIAKAGIHSPDLIILDYCLPDLTADIVVREIRLNEDGKSAFIILITAAVEHIEEKAKKVEAVTYLKKPFELDQLYTKIERLLTL